MAEKKCSNVHKLASGSPDEISGILPPDLEGITDCLLRFSTGIEATQDLIDDLAQAFAAVK